MTVDSVVNCLHVPETGGTLKINCLSKWILQDLKGIWNIGQNLFIPEWCLFEIMSRTSEKIFAMNWLKIYLLKQI